MTTTLYSPTGSYEHKTTVVSDESKLTEELSSFLHIIYSETTPSWTTSRVVGFGIEKSFTTLPTIPFVLFKVALLKLCVRSHCLIIDVQRFSTMPTSLAKFLDISTLKFVGNRIKQDASDLYRDYGLGVRNTTEFEDDLFPLGEHRLSAVSFIKDPKVAFLDWNTSMCSTVCRHCVMQHVSMDVLYVFLCYPVGK